jgi:hypothetical protein
MLMLTYRKAWVNNGLHECRLAPVKRSHLPEIESVGINAFERVLLLTLDCFLEGVDRLIVGDFDLKDATGVIAEHNAVDVEA